MCWPLPSLWLRQEKLIDESDRDWVINRLMLQQLTDDRYLGSAVGLCS